MGKGKKKQKKDDLISIQNEKEKVEMTEERRD